jgi:predicted nicotinamide N-methyase
MIVRWKYNNLYTNEKYLPFRTYFFNYKKLVIHQKTQDIDKQTGNIIWDGAYILSQYLYQHVPLQNKTIVELGSGHGFLSLVCALAGAPKVIATDLPDQLDLVQKNIQENQDKGTDRVLIRPLLW